MKYDIFICNFPPSQMNVEAVIFEWDVKSNSLVEILVGVMELWFTYHIPV